MPLVWKGVVGEEQGQLAVPLFHNLHLPRVLRVKVQLYKEGNGMLSSSVC